MKLNLCFNLQTQTIIIATISIGYSLLSAIGTIQNWAYPVLIDEKLNLNNENNQIYCHKISNSPFFLPLMFPDIIGYLFILLYMISSGFLLRGAILCEKYYVIPWLTLTSFCIVLHVGSSIIQLAIFFSVKCTTPDEFTSLIGLLFISVLEMYFIATVYCFYDKLDDDLLSQQNDNYLSHHSPATNSHVNITPGVYTLSLPITNELPPSYSSISLNNPPLYVDAIAHMSSSIIINKSNQ